MEITPEFLIPVIMAGVAIIGLIWELIRMRKSITPSKLDLIITGMYALAKMIYRDLKNDGKIDSEELQAIFVQIKAILAELQGKELQVLDSEFPLVKPASEDRIVSDNCCTE